MEKDFNLECESYLRLKIMTILLGRFQFPPVCFPIPSLTCLFLASLNLYLIPSLVCRHTVFVLPRVCQFVPSTSISFCLCPCSPVLLFVFLPLRRHPVFSSSVSSFLPLVCFFLFSLLDFSFNCTWLLLHFV